MPKFNIVRNSKIEKTARVLQLSGLFDIPPTEKSELVWNVDLPIDFDWQIGLILGASGSGKSTLAKEAFGNAKHLLANQGYEWPENKAVIDGFDPGMSIKNITGALSSVGFSSPPAWMRPFSCLSTGEQFRATLARAIVDPNPIVVVDEFTSVIDRTVAKIGSAAVSKAIKKQKTKQIVCVTCHYDVEEWLCPDWVIEMPKGEFTRRALQRPKIDLQIKRVHSSAWELFKHHHYLSSSHNNAAICFCGFIDERPVAFSSVLSFPHPFSPGWREHRTVVLPDFQGLGIGNRMSEYVGSLISATGKPFISTTANPAMATHRKRSSNWVQTKKMSLNSGGYNQDSINIRLRKSAALNRFTSSFKYVGVTNLDEAKKFGLL